MTNSGGKEAVDDEEDGSEGIDTDIQPTGAPDEVDLCPPEFLKKLSELQRTVIPTNWPILGMMPKILINAHRIHDYATDILLQSSGTFRVKGPWFANMDLLLITNPLDVYHVLSKNFNNYPRGDAFRKIFRFLGDGLISSDGRLWEINHKVTISVLKHAGFQDFLETVVWNKVENGLLPILESICERCTAADLQDIFQRFTFDTICKEKTARPALCLGSFIVLQETQL
ncbi:hypothetical protein L2E82_07831 [Cichorium intybus]|uniref:Uncharacterized protein n=1 Tax=Cichorium intybus TaxID=13427 RepID=A0ACB9G4Z7_CICIN|nr:hypothetical protein L2E82_07831 [Cichorium intybus]